MGGVKRTGPISMMEEINWLINQLGHFNDFPPSEKKSSMKEKILFPLEQILSF